APETGPSEFLRSRESPVVPISTHSPNADPSSPTVISGTVEANRMDAGFERTSTTSGATLTMTKTTTTLLRWFPPYAMMAAVLWSAVLATAARAGETSQAETEKGKALTKTQSGLQYRDIEEGKGAKPKDEEVCIVHYTGWLWAN